MGKYSIDKVMDAGLNYIRENCNLIVACSGQPADYASAFELYNPQGGHKLASTPVAPVDFLLGNGTSSGRALAVSNKEKFVVLASGQMDHVALLKADPGYATGELIYVTTVTNSQSLTAGNTLTIPQWDITISDPV